jgi:DNA-binding response OmpR family regulator
MERKKALIAEDEFLVALEIEQELENLGFDVVGPATRVADAARLAADEDLALGVLDINLRSDESWPVARALKERGVPFFFLTGRINAHQSMPDDLRDAEICYKPLDPNQLRRVIARLAH